MRGRLAATAAELLRRVGGVTGSRGDLVMAEAAVLSAEASIEAGAQLERIAVALEKLGEHAAVIADRLGELEQIRNRLDIMDGVFSR